MVALSLVDLSTIEDFGKSGTNELSAQRFEGTSVNVKHRPCSMKGANKRLPGSPRCAPFNIITLDPVLSNLMQIKNSLSTSDGSAPNAGVP